MRSKNNAQEDDALNISQINAEESIKNSFTAQRRCQSLSFCRRVVSGLSMSVYAPRFGEYFGKWIV